MNATRNELVTTDQKIRQLLILSLRQRSDYKEQHRNSKTEEWFLTGTAKARG